MLSPRSMTRSSLSVRFVVPISVLSGTRTCKPYMLQLAWRVMGRVRPLAEVAVISVRHVSNSTTSSDLLIVYRLPEGSPLIGIECVICFEEFEVPLSWCSPLIRRLETRCRGQSVFVIFIVIVSVIGFGLETVVRCILLEARQWHHSKSSLQRFKFRHTFRALHRISNNIYMEHLGASFVINTVPENLKNPASSSPYHK